MYIFNTMNTGIESFANVISQFKKVIMNVVSVSLAQGFPSNLVGQIKGFFE